LNCKAFLQRTPNLRIQPSRFVIAEWESNSSKSCEFALDQYNGRHTINGRVWYHDDDDVLKPGKTGITLALKHLPALADAMGKALATARDLGPDRGGPSPPD
jgi:hypothetical protein